VSTEINILLHAVDKASDVIQGVATKTDRSLSQVEKANQKVGKSSKDVALAFNNVATSGFALYNAVDRVMDMQVQVDKANLAVKTSLNSVEDAQTRYNTAVNKFGAESEQAQAAAKDLQLAQERYQVACERADMIQGNLNEAMVQSALTVIPSLITMITSISTLTQGWTAVTQGVSGALNFLAANPIVLVVAGIAALIAGLVWAYQNCEPFRNAINAIASVLGGALSFAITAVYGALKWLWDTVLVPLGQFIVSVFAAYWQGLVLVWTNYVLPAVNAVKGALEWFWNNILVPLGNYVGGALLAAWNAFAGGISWAYNNLIKPVIDAISWAYNNILKPIGDFFGGIGKGISDWWGGVTGGIGSWWSGLTGGGSSQPSVKIPGAQHGGIVKRPTLLWAGEAGPEAIVPLNRGLGSVNVTINIEGSADKATAELAAKLVAQKLRSVIVEATSSSAPSTMRRIRDQSTVF
jgi:hypothetical protein